MCASLPKEKEMECPVEALRQQLAEARAMRPWRLSQLLRRIRRGG
jgi:hypothetical protein